MEERSQSADERPRPSTATDVLIEVLARLDPEARRELLASSTDLAPELISTVDARIAAGERGGELSRLLAGASTAETDERLRARLAELADQGARRARFRDAELLGRGGMGEVLSCYDTLLRREVALKRLRREACAGLDQAWVRRFVDEAQITAQLEHPGIPPVHDVGLDADGRPFFAMQRVRGRHLGEVLDAHARGGTLDGQRWPLERVVDVLRRAGEAVAHAHARGVVHRDLKPDNVMVGEFGAVQVVDWGLARVFGEDGAAGAEYAPPPVLGTDRTAFPDGPDATQAGAVLGTLQYMAPEQTRPNAGPAGPTADVYALGAILYRALSGHAPYGATRRTSTQAELLDAVREGSPPPIEAVAPQAPPELRAICARAMERDPARRYPTLAELVADLDAYLEHRVVGAYRTGPVVRLAKWIERNRGPAGTAAAAAVAVLVAAVGWRTGAVRAERTARRLELVERSRLALELPAQVEALAAEARALLPLHPRHEPALLALRARADALVNSDAARSLAQELEAELAALGGTPAGAARTASERRAELTELVRRTERTFEVVGADRFAPEFRARLEAWRAELDRLEDAREDEPGDADASGRPTARAAALGRVLDAFALLDGLRDRAVPLADPELPTHETQLALVAHLRAVQERPEVRAAWEQARARWRDPDGPYAGSEPSLAVDPRLAPLGVDPESGLLEFAHLATGDLPTRDADGRLALDAGSAVVLVALPGGALYVGAVTDGPGNVDPLAEERDGPCRGVMLWSFLIGKHELTQAQFERLAGANPSTYAAGGPSPAGLPPIDGRHPVESVDRGEAGRVLAAVGLRLPTSSQWEYAARAGTTTPWSTGATADSLRGHANLLDRAALALPGRPATWDQGAEFASGFEDPWPVHAPVGSCAPNAFGLHDVHGNVHEWCEDAFHTYDGGDGAWLLHGRGELAHFDALAPRAGELQVARGGSFASDAGDARAARRLSLQAGYLRENLGLRPALEFVRTVD